jgi:hypothetical protein
MAFEEVPKIHVSITRRVSDGNYGSGEVHISVTHIPFDATPDEVDACIEKAGIVTDKLKLKLREKVAAIRKEDLQFGPAPAGIDQNSQMVAR